ncbi:hypothetical protein LR48_Vigan01g278200 [Vigna angularis]|uniref:Uncharacterized protein n=1 Tax=Phaseolus angularis TaxID=3914 RepID=A0A0L9TRW3_PHAAN|nr:hypothetical protein LR48_Vigan01g278200 [Vigna angularis]
MEVGPFLPPPKGSDGPPWWLPSMLSCRLEADNSGGGCCALSAASSSASSSACLRWSSCCSRIVCACASICVCSCWIKSRVLKSSIAPVVVVGISNLDPTVDAKMFQYGCETEIRT